MQALRKLTAGPVFAAIRRLSAPALAMFLLAGVLAVLWPSSPARMPLPYRDSGVYLYVGWRILEGDLPYQDVWDHKPPVVHYLNAAGLALGGGSRWGVWILEVLALWVAALLAHRVLANTLGPVTGLIVGSLFVATLPLLLEGGNLPEEYVLPVVLGGYTVAHAASRRDWPAGHLLLLGALGGLAFWTKQTAVSASVAIAAYLALVRLTARNGRQLAFDYAAMACGFAVSTALIVLPFIAGAALSDFWDNVFAYNFAYAGQAGGHSNFGGTFQVAWLATYPTQLLTLALAGWGIGMAHLYQHRKRTSRAINDLAPVLAIALMDFPTAIILAELSGRAYRHYLLLLLPAAVVLAAFLVFQFVARLANPAYVRPFLARSALALSSVVICLGVFIASWRAYQHYAAELASNQRDQVIQYVHANASSSAGLLMWGSEAAINFATESPAPGRFVYQSALSTPGYASEVLILEFLTDVCDHPPLLIVDTLGDGIEATAFAVQSEAIGRVLASVRGQYEKVETIQQWTFYRRLGNQDGNLQLPVNCLPPQSWLHLSARV